MRLSILRLAILSTPLALTACGDGWEAVKTTEYFPYGNKRTAGSGVAYVLARMMPEKELNVAEPVVEPPPAPAEPAPALEAEAIFNEAQSKGGSPMPAKTPEEAAPADEEMEGVALDMNNGSQKLLEQNIKTAATEQDSELHVSEIEPAAGIEEPGVYPNRVIEPSHVITMPEDHIVSPKVEVIELTSEGQKSLNQIYKDDF